MLSFLRFLCTINALVDVFASSKEYNSGGYTRLLRHYSQACSRSSFKSLTIIVCFYNQTRTQPNPCEEKALLRVLFWVLRGLGRGFLSFSIPLFPYNHMCVLWWAFIYGSYSTTLHHSLVPPHPPHILPRRSSVSSSWSSGV